MHHAVSRREVLSALGSGAILNRCSPKRSPFQIALFTADVTPPLGYPIMGGLYQPATRVEDPLFAHGLALVGAGPPVVVVAVDWCEIRNDAYERWRAVLAQAAETTPERVMVSCVHQHKAPHSDWQAQAFYEEFKVGSRLCDPVADEAVLQRVAAALTAALQNPQELTHLGVGQTRVEKVASNRRTKTPEGKFAWNRLSFTKDRAVRDQPEGLIDPWLRTISFWQGDRPMAAVSSFAVHPQTHFGDGAVTADFLGWARARRFKDDPAIPQIFLNGCAGDVVAGKYNEGERRSWEELSGRVYQGLVDAWTATERFPIESVQFRSAPMHLPHRTSAGYSIEEFKATLADPAKPMVRRWEAALGLSWRKRLDARIPIDVPALDFGKGVLVLMPAETFVGYQLKAHQMRPESTVIVAGYGESAPGYIPTAHDAAEGYEDSYSWVAYPECERPMLDALARVLKPTV